MIELVSANVTLDRHHIRAWSGVAVDEGVGLICMVEVSDDTGRPVARFEEFLDASVHRTNPAWPRDDTEAARQLQDRALNRARTAIAANTLPSLNGHRFEVTDLPNPPPREGEGCAPPGFYPLLLQYHLRTKPSS